MQKAFTLLEIVLVLLLLGILLSIGIPNFLNLTQNTCIKKLQLQVLQLKFALKTQHKQAINWDALYEHLDFKAGNCNFAKQKNGFIANDNGRKAYFVLKNSVLECQHTKSAKLHNGESLCDVF